MFAGVLGHARGIIAGKRFRNRLVGVRPILPGLVEGSEGLRSFDPAEGLARRWLPRNTVQVHLGLSQLHVPVSQRTVMNNVA